MSREVEGVLKAANVNPVAILVTDGTNLQIAKGNSSGEIIFVPSTTVGEEPNSPTKVSANFTRPTDTNAYAIADAIANSTTGSAVVPMQFTAARAVGLTGMVIGAQCITDSATAFGAIRLHLFNTTPFAAAGFQADNAALALTYTALTTGSAGSSPNYIGYVDFTTFVAQSVSAVSIGQADQTQMDFACAAASQVIFGLLEARAVFTPGNGQKFTVALDVVQG